MNTKQLIEQKAETYAREGSESLLSENSHMPSRKLNSALFMAYKAGAEAAIEIANTWIPITDRLPENKDIILVKTNNECVMTAYLHGKESGFICYGDDAYDGVGVVTHWKPITL